MLSVKEHNWEKLFNSWAI